MAVEKKTIFDVGLHKGEDTDYYLKKGFRVVAFEADPDLINLCKAKFNKEITTGDLAIVEGAIVDFDKTEETPDRIKFYKNNKTSVWGTVVTEWADRNKWLGSDSEIIEVPTINFSKCIEKYGVPYYIKIDIEGMDTVCLRSLLNVQERPSYISIESNKVHFDGLMEEIELFKKLGYDEFQAINQTKVQRQKEPQNTEEGDYLNYKFKSGSTGLFGADLKTQNWLNTEDIVSRYQKIFKGYDLLGEKSKPHQNYVGMKFIKVLNRFVGYPGWYDTHAKHSSVKSVN